MKQSNRVYVKLQKHLDNQTVGFPATRSCVEIKILKHILVKQKGVTMAITEGKTAPAFTLPDQNGNKVALKDFRGKNVILYFYPKDNTSG